ncbi:DUF6193 family natural product biosynthesis protein [Actinocorallia longicatena]|uniref:Uncharacterized protein n=1 Tax=Actinocorallia longicatena TaxID=111803 RepID=A0ABP6QJ86_9ACTN
MTRGADTSASEIFARLYPEIIAAGGLAEALTAAFRSAGFRDLRAVAREDGAADVDLGWGRFFVHLAAEERWFIFDLWWRGVRLLGGTTPDLLTVVELAGARSSGATLRELTNGWPCADSDEIAAAVDRADPALAVALHWRELRAARWAEPIRPLVEAAHADPRLRKLRPWTSHLSLHFSRCVGYPFTHDLPAIHPQERGYLVWDGDRLLGSADGPEEAVALVTAVLPADCAPAVLGTADDLD